MKAIAERAPGACSRSDTHSTGFCRAKPDAQHYLLRDHGRSVWFPDAPLGICCFSLLALVIYAVFTTGFSGLGRVYDVMFAGVALQVGYFLAVLVHVGRPRLLESADTETTVETSNKDQARPLSKTRIHQVQDKHW